jgi:hypothetical protein
MTFWKGLSRQGKIIAYASAAVLLACLLWPLSDHEPEAENKVEETLSVPVTQIAPEIPLEVTTAATPVLLPKVLVKAVKQTRHPANSASGTPAKITPKPDGNAEAIREPAAVETESIIKADIAKPTPTNDKYNSSTIDLNGFLWTLYSSEQYHLGETAPVASGFGAHGYYWNNSHGFEGIAKTGAMGLNGAGGEQSSLKDFEARYHYRFFTKFPYDWTRELQVSIFGGYEVYRNAGGSFSGQYDLFKFGTSLDFPWATKWSGGGEFVLGSGAEKSLKLEISGRVAYFFARDWSFGLGYRLHLFEARSDASAATGGLPYREGYTEGFSNLIYHF